MTTVELLPADSYNETLVANVHPPQWRNPTPAPLYNLVVIGAGSAGLVATAGAAGLGAKVAIIERHLLGGDCLNVGCVPSKSVIRPAKLMGELAKDTALGIHLPTPPEVDFGAVMARMRQIRAQISHHDSAQRFQGLGADVFLGEGRFTSPHTIEVGGQTLRFQKAIIATGTRPQIPPIPGLAEVGYLTNESIFTLTERPARLAVIGAGPVGCELAQAFHRLGSQVILFNRSPRVLRHDDDDAAAIIQQRFEQDGIRLALGAEISQVARAGGAITIHFTHQGHTQETSVDALLVATGRTPNLEGLQLEAAGVAYNSRQGVIVNDFLQTSNAKIYAAGDICMAAKFTHAADASARIALQNALFLGRKKHSALTIPWCTYTDPEVAHIGLTPASAQARQIEIDTYLRPFKEVDRAITDGETEGFVKLHTKRGRDTILGATIVAPHAGDMISEVAVAMAGNLGLQTLATVIHPYPTLADAIRQTGDAYNRTRLTPLVKRILTTWLAWSRRSPSS